MWQELSLPYKFQEDLHEKYSSLSFSGKSQPIFLNRWQINFDSRGLVVNLSNLISIDCPIFQLILGSQKLNRTFVIKQ